ncbi:energy-coupling factor ABC transporter ATP-binding protein [Paenibacillus sp. NPDC056579]|uniref:energy-coupling factor ABC transporter ATP-binding protein n=1 Tax=Paenibacillus sp. NPDC056579 TaxID=3345871 RepID=UPI0036C938AC
MSTNDILKLSQAALTLDTADGPRTVLHPVDLQIHEGEWIALVGSNGCGKSTLAKVMAGLQPPTYGTVSLTAEDQPPVQLVFQNPDTSIIGETVYEDLCFVMENYGVSEEQMPARAAEALDKVGLANRIHAPASTLSGGQKQLLAIAGCLVVEPAIYIFDEATSMLDPMSRQTILSIAGKLHREGKTIIWITQLLDELAETDRVVGMEDGRLVFDGTPREFFFQRPQSGERSSCEQLGFTPPYTVRVVQQLFEQGYILNPPPLTPEELSKAVSEL